MTFTAYLTLIGTLFLIWLLLVLLFTPGIDYHVCDRIEADTDEFEHLVQTSCQAAEYLDNRIQILTDGSAFYPAMLEAIRGATRTVNLECYIFEPGGIGDRFIDELSERARAGVLVTVVVDAIGSAALAGRAIDRLVAAGCRVERYQMLRWYSLHRLNNRTHRELLVVDGRVGFVGGAGIADWWMPEDGTRGWRDTMARIDGPIVAALQGVFAENWLECCGEILTGDAHFPTLGPAGRTAGLVVKSSPADRATVSRVVFQLLIDGASREIRISTPYFLPDRALRRCLLQSAARGVSIDVIVPGPTTDQRLVRLASRRLYGELLPGGIRIFEYEPAMTHAKALVVDRLWSVLGTTNIDNRSFEHNDEVNIAVRDDQIAGRLLEDFERDREASTEVTLDRWRRRSIVEKALSPVAWILERQQ